MRLFTTAVELLLAASSVRAISPLMTSQLSAPKVELAKSQKIVDVASVIQKRQIVEATFDQLIDHSDPSKGTFKQRYFYNDEFYAGEGSPIVVSAPGENAADGYEGYTTNLTISGAFAQAIGGGAIIIEHRYWGGSSPYDKLTTKNLQHLTLDNAIQDLIYFAKNVQLPFDPKRTSSPDKAPWVLSGCSYSGALTAWVHATAPGTFWTYHCSSAVVEAMEELWQYFDVTEQAMPRNCSADVQRVVRYVDRVMTNGTDAAKQNLKNRFGMGELEHDQDFASALMDGLWAEQSLEFDTGYNSFHRFCDYVENRWPGSQSPQPDENGVGVCKALKGMTKWFKELDLPGACSFYGYWKDKNTLACYNSFNASSPLYTDVTVRNPINRQWNWMLCNEPFKWWRTRGPLGKPSVISKLVTKEYSERQCGLYFPPEGEYTYGIAKGRTTEDVNKVTGGWDNVKTKRLMWTVGELDPWKPATVASQWRPGGPLKSTPEAPVRIIPGATHCGDMLLRNANANAGVKAVYDAEVENVKKWVAEFYTEKNKPRPGYKG